MIRQADLPADLAHPRGERASLIANLVVAAILLAITGGMIAAGLAMVSWAS